MQQGLLWDASGRNVGSSELRDIVVTQSARAMNIQRPQRGIHQIAVKTRLINARPPEGMGPEELSMSEGITKPGELIAAFQNTIARNNGSGNGRPEPTRNDRPPRQQTGDRPLRKCANCGHTHEGKCNVAEVPRGQRDGPLDHWRTGLVGAVQYWAEGSRADAARLICSLINRLELKVPSRPPTPSCYHPLSIHIVHCHLRRT